MRSTSAEARRACRHQPWLTRTPRCGLRTRPLRTVRPGAQGSYCTGLGRFMRAWVWHGVWHLHLPHQLVLPGHIGQSHWYRRPAVPTHAPWHHRSSSSRSRSTETLPPRGAMATSCVDTYIRPGASRLGTVGAVRATGANLPACAPKAQGSLPRGGTHCTYAVRVPASGVPHVPRRTVAQA